MDLYLPVAEMSVQAIWLIALGLVVGFLSGLFGVGGGFLLTPLLTFIGIPPAIAVGTQSVQLAGTSLSGAIGQWRARNVDPKMGTILMVGSFAGTAVGVQIFGWLKQLGQINLVIVLGYVTLLTSIGAMMFFESFPRLMKARERERKPSSAGQVDISEKGMLKGWWADKPFALDFPGSNLRVNVLLPLGLGFVGGVLVALLGVGGGFIMVPAMIYILRMPPALVNGTSLFQIVFTTAFAGVLQAVTNHSVDIVLALLLLLGSVVSVPMGSRLALHLSPVVARFLMSVLILGVAGMLIADLTIAPEIPFAVEVTLK